MTVFITGITGFAGGEIANEFARMGFDVVGVGRKNMLPAHVDKRCRYMQADIVNPIEKITADIVVHAAAQVDDTATYEEHFLINVTGTKNVLNACVDVKRFIYISTSSVYSFDRPLPYKEDDGGKEFAKLSNYGKTKFLAELEVNKNRNIPIKIILRPRAIYGVGDSVLLPRLRRLLKFNRLFLPTNLTDNISLTNIESLVNIVVKCATQDHAGGTYNIADDEVYSLKIAIPLLLQCTTLKKIKVIWLPKRLWLAIVKANAVLRFIPSLTSFGAKQLTQVAVLNITKAKEEIAYISAKHLNDSLEDITKWYHEGVGGCFGGKSGYVYKVAKYIKFF